MKHLFSCACLLILYTASVTASDEHIGAIRISDGSTIFILNNSVTDNHYFIKADNKFIPLSQIRRISRATFSQGYNWFVVQLKDGTFLEARHGRMYFQKTHYQYNGLDKTAFIPVMKGRDSKGLIVQQYRPKTGKTNMHEIINPNDIVEYSSKINLPGKTGPKEEQQTIESHQPIKGGNLFQNLLG
ncbi:MAG: hypothetical protein OEX19_15795 [Gammaproteobacteria bacterium]|nr:hypothetical protein [Gammaproteobacteria bacterium]